MPDKVFVHPTAIVETDQIGQGTRVWAFTHVMAGASIGKNCNIGEHCFIESGVIVENDSTIKNGNMLWEGVVLKEGVFVGPGVSFTNDRYPRSARLPEAEKKYSNRGWLLPTQVNKGASLGAGSVILPGLTIGAFATVGAGAVVTREVPAHALVAGNPARVRGWSCCCGEPLTFHQAEAICSACRKRFRQTGDPISVSKVI